MVKKKQKLNVALVEKVNQKFEGRREVSIPIEIEGEPQTAWLEIDEVFKPSKIRACIEEFVSKIDAVRKTNENHMQEVMEAYLIFLVIKHFTSFPAPKLYIDQVSVIKMMIETELLYTIASHFDPKEIEKITKEVEKVAEVLEGNLDEYVQMAEAMGLGETKEEE